MAVQETLYHLACVTRGLNCVSMLVLDQPSLLVIHSVWTLGTQSPFTEMRGEVSPRLFCICCVIFLFSSYLDKCIMENSFIVGTLVINGKEYKGESPGDFRGLDLTEDMYVGGLPDFSSIARDAGFNTGFVGQLKTDL